MKKFLFLFSLCVSFAAHAHVIIFDIHGVILEENLSQFVAQKISSAFSAQSAAGHRSHIELSETCSNIAQVARLFSGDISITRSIHSNPLYLKLCTLMATHQPLGAPEEVPAGIPLPWEVYALFCGKFSPERTHSALSQMIIHAELSESDRLMLATLVDAIFDRENFTQTMTPVPATQRLLETLVADPQHTIYIYSNAPAQWVDHYTTIFPDIFTLPSLTITSSGHTGHLKPLHASFQTVADAATCTLPELFLIDDTGHNIKGAQSFGLTTHQYKAHNLDNFSELTTKLVNQSIITTKAKESLDSFAAQAISSKK